MSHPFSRTDSFSSAGSGDEYETKAHSTIGLYVRAIGSTDPMNITFDVEVQGSPDGKHWVPLNRPSQSNVLRLTDSDAVVTQNSGPAVKAAYIVAHNFAIEMVRVTVNSVSPDTDSLEATIFMSGNTARGTQFNRDLNI